MGPAQPVTRKFFSLFFFRVHRKLEMKAMSTWLLQLTFYSTTATETVYANGTKTAYVNATVTDSYT